MDEEDYPSDTSDEDYAPEEEVVSEEEGSGEEENFVADGDAKVGGSRRKKTIKLKEKLVRKRKGGIKLDDEDNDDKATEENDTYNQELAQKIKEEKEAKKEEETKKKADSLWADFMKDVGGPSSKPKPSSSSALGALCSTSKSSSSQSIPTASKTTESVTEKSESKKDPLGKITITKEFDFAGEIVKVTKEVDANSKEAKAELKKKEEIEKETEKPTAGPSLAKLGIKRPGGGLGSVLGKIGKKPKMSTLEKSKLDWNSFKDAEGISEDLAQHNRGKQGYIERKAFLERADLRQFEIEKNMRLSGKR